MSSGRRSDLGWLEVQLNTMYNVKTQRPRVQAGMRDMHTLNRNVRISSTGYDMEGCPMHSELITEQMAQCDSKKEDHNNNINNNNNDGMTPRAMACKRLQHVAKYTRLNPSLM